MPAVSDERQHPEDAAGEQATSEAAKAYETWRGWENPYVERYEELLDQEEAEGGLSGFAADTVRDERPTPDRIVYLDPAVAFRRRAAVVEDDEEINIARLTILRQYAHRLGSKRASYWDSVLGTEVAKAEGETGTRYIVEIPDDFIYPERAILDLWAMGMSQRGIRHFMEYAEVLGPVREDDAEYAAKCREEVEHLRKVIPRRRAEIEAMRVTSLRRMQHRPAKGLHRFGRRASRGRAAKRGGSRRDSSASTSTSRGGDPPDGDGEHDGAAALRRSAVLMVVLLLGVLGVTDGYFAQKEERQREAWIASTVPFDFTGSYLDGEADDVTGTTDVVDHFERELEDERRFCDAYNDFHPLIAVDLKALLALDERAFESGDDSLLRDPDFWNCEPRNDPEYADHKYMTWRSMLASARELAKRDPTFWPRLRRRGVTPDLVKEALHLLRRPSHSREGARVAARKAAAVRVIVPLRRRGTGHGREARPGSTRVRGSRRVTSRSAGGGGDDPDPEQRPALGRSSSEAVAA